MLGVSFLFLVQLVSEHFDKGTLCGCITDRPLCVDDRGAPPPFCIHVGIKECLCFWLRERMAEARAVDGL